MSYFQVHLFLQNKARCLHFSYRKKINKSVYCLDKLPLLPTRLQLLRLIYLGAVHGFLFMLLEISNSLQCVCSLWAVSVMKVLGLVANI